MRPLHTATGATDSSLRKTSSRVVLQVQQDYPAGDSRGFRASAPGTSTKANALTRQCDTLFIILALALGLSVVGMLFVHKLFINSTTAGSGVLEAETRQHLQPDPWA